MKLSVLNINMSLPDLNPIVYRDENEKEWKGLHINVWLLKLPG